MECARHLHRSEIFKLLTWIKISRFHPFQPLLRYFGGLTRLLIHPLHYFFMVTGGPLMKRFALWYGFHQPAEIA